MAIRHSLPGYAPAGEARIQSRLALQLEKKASAVYAASAAASAGGAEGEVLEEDVLEDRTSRRFSGVSAVSDADDLTLWT